MTPIHSRSRLTPRTVLLLGVAACLSALLIVLLGGDAIPVAAPEQADPASAVAAAAVEDAALVEPIAAQDGTNLRLNGFDGRAVDSGGRPDLPTWTVRFECTVQDPTGPLRNRVDVVIDGPDLAFQGIARRQKNQKTFEVQVPAEPGSLAGATLFVATTKRALLHRHRRPFRWFPRFDHYRLGRATLSASYCDRDRLEAAIPSVFLEPPTMLGHIQRGAFPKAVDELLVWTRPTRSSIHTLRWDPSSFGRTIPFAAFVDGGRWGAGERLPEPDEPADPFQGSAPVGSDVYLYHPTGVLDLTVDLRALPAARSILVREAASTVPAALTAAQLNERAVGLGSGVTTLSDKIVGRGLHENFPVGKTMLRSGIYAVEAWSKPNSAGLMNLVASKSVTLGAGTQKVTLR